jgi:8-oxo-dGTP pyrophosphatase MutT (NUDIX family)
VVWRSRKRGRRVDVLLVHRPDHCDWSLPKGRRHPGESALDCALREVREETGLRCRPGDELPSLRFRDRFDRRRMVRYWAMEPVGGAFEPTDEIDAVRWVRLHRLADHLTNPRELLVVQGLRLVTASAA